MTTRRFQHVHQTGMAQAAPVPEPDVGGDPRVWILGPSTGESDLGGNVSMISYSDSLPMFCDGFHDVNTAIDFSASNEDPFSYTFLVVGSQSPNGPVNTARMRWNLLPEDAAPLYGPGHNVVAMHHFEPTFADATAGDDATSRYHIAPCEFPPNPVRHDITANGWWNGSSATMIGPASATGVYHSLCVLHSVRGDGANPHAFIYNDVGATHANYHLLTTYTFTSGPTTRHPGHQERIELWYAALDVASSYSVFWDADDTTQSDSFAPGQQQVMTVNAWSHKPTTLHAYQITEIYNSATRPTTLNVTYPFVSVPPYDIYDPASFKVAIPVLYSEPTPYTTSGAGSIIPVTTTGGLDNVSPLAVGSIDYGDYTMLAPWPTPPFPFENVLIGRCGFIPNNGDGSGDSFAVGTTPAATSPVWKAYGITAVFA